MMTRRHIWMGLRPIAAAAVAMGAWLAAMWLTSFLPGVNAGKFLSTFGLTVSGGLFLGLLVAGTWILRLRWWDCALPVLIPLAVVGFDITDYWTGRVWLAFVLPMIISAGFAAWRQRARSVA